MGACLSACYGTAGGGKGADAMVRRKSRRFDMFSEVQIVTQTEAWSGREHRAALGQLELEYAAAAVEVLELAQRAGLVGDGRGGGSEADAVDAGRRIEEAYAKLEDLTRRQRERRARLADEARRRRIEWRAAREQRRREGDAARETPASTGATSEDAGEEEGSDTSERQGGEQRSVTWKPMSAEEAQAAAEDQGGRFYDEFPSGLRVDALFQRIRSRRRRAATCGDGVEGDAEDARGGDAAGAPRQPPSPQDLAARLRLAVERLKRAHNDLGLRMAMRRNVLANRTGISSKSLTRLMTSRRDRDSGDGDDAFHDASASLSSDDPPQSTTSAPSGRAASMSGGSKPWGLFVATSRKGDKAEGTSPKPSPRTQKSAAQTFVGGGSAKGSYYGTTKDIGVDMDEVNADDSRGTKMYDNLASATRGTTAASAAAFRYSGLSLTRRLGTTDAVRGALLHDIIGIASECAEALVARVEAHHGRTGRGGDAALRRSRSDGRAGRGGDDALRRSRSDASVGARSKADSKARTEPSDGFVPVRILSIARCEQLVSEFTHQQPRALVVCQRAVRAYNGRRRAQRTLQAVLTFQSAYRRGRVRRLVLALDNLAEGQMPAMKEGTTCALGNFSSASLEVIGRKRRLALDAALAEHAGTNRPTPWNSARAGDRDRKKRARTAARERAWQLAVARAALAQLTDEAEFDEGAVAAAFERVLAEDARGALD